MWHIGEREEVHTGFGWGYLKERDYLEDLGVDGKVILKLTLKKSVYRAWTRLIWLRIGTYGRIVCTH